MSIIKNKYSETDYNYDVPVDNGYDYFLMCVCATIIIWYISVIE